MKLDYIACGDCLTLMSDIPDKSVDLVVADPPYNISRPNNFHTMRNVRQGMDFGEWDKAFNVTGYISSFPRILKENANVVIFSCWENLKDIKDACEENNISIKRCLVLNKSNPAPFNRDRMFVNDATDFALWGVYSSKKKPVKWTFNRKNKFEKCCMSTTVQSSKFHPTMKDVKVIKHLVELLSNEGDVVLDPFLGSGTTALACIATNRHYIGFEKEEKYFDICCKRIDEATKGKEI